eukprot:gnl/TRDRNA2_/TRDRNA2_177166_c0_seq1.p1 gnl/TRDRNA2_/TRDRNA2_177166_c0~~gnl/TRDRNA2_/TRDRNA2_177166_c0_seq1.p1  ORF type:complete len:623 (-),score=113.79 gnl/TRDRNA2_/TRDRNA2_177166_c0_seq1:406-2274(-)
MGFLSGLKKSLSLTSLTKSSAKVEVFQAPAVEKDEKPELAPKTTGFDEAAKPVAVKQPHSAAKQPRLSSSDLGAHLSATTTVHPPEHDKSRGYSQHKPPKVSSPPARKVNTPMAAEWPTGSKSANSLLRDVDRTEPAPLPPVVESEVEESAQKVPTPVASSEPAATVPLERRFRPDKLPALSGWRDSELQQSPTPSTPVLSMSLVGSDPDMVSFAESQDQIWFKVGNAFGQMIASSLQASKWEKRVQALKSVSMVLKGLDLGGMAKPGSTGQLGKGLKLRDREACWRSSCLLLHHLLRDKVMPVRLAAHDLFLDTFTNAEGLVSKQEIHYALGMLIDPLIDRLGDSNLRLHESARKCILFCAQHPGLFGITAVLARLQARLVATSKKTDRAKIYFGVLDAVGHLLEHFPGICENDRGTKVSSTEESSWTLSGIKPFIAAGMDTSLGHHALGPRVASCSVKLAVTAYKTFGVKAVEPLLSDLHPTKQKMLKQKFQESEEERSDEATTPNTTGATTKANSEDMSHSVPTPGTSSKAKHTNSGSPEKPSARSRDLSTEDDETEGLMDAILEDTGMVFSGAGIMDAPQGFRRIQGQGSLSIGKANGKYVDSFQLEKSFPGVIVNPI